MPLGIEAMFHVLLAVEIIDEPEVSRVHTPRQVRVKGASLRLFSLRGLQPPTLLALNGAI